MSWALFVEGDWDEVFVRWLLGRLGVENVSVSPIGGGVSMLRNVDNQIRRSSDEGNRVALLLDADTHPQQTRVDLATEIERLGLQVERSFLLPDDTGPGDLETLLEQMAPAAHGAVYPCFAEYEACLRRGDPTYVVPNRKARVYAYCHAVGAETGPNKNYDDETHWDPEVAGLVPLSRFLRDLVG